MEKKKEEDTIDHLVAFLQKRDGIDKTLKIIRYSSKLLLSTVLKNSQSEVSKRLSSLESSIGTSRKAMRLGKFLQNVNSLRKTSALTPYGLLELIASGGEGAYYFIEQFIWLVKAGGIDKKHAPLLQKMSAWTELIGYFGSVTLKSIQISSLIKQESLLMEELQAKYQSTQPQLIREHAHLLDMLQTVRMKITMKNVSVLQDLADALLALNDIWEGKSSLSHPALLSLAGLVSALISAHKNWII